MFTTFALKSGKVVLFSLRPPSTLSPVVDLLLHTGVGRPVAIFRRAKLVRRRRASNTVSPLLLFPYRSSSLLVGFWQQVVASCQGPFNVCLYRSPYRILSGFQDGGGIWGHRRDGHPQHRGRVGVPRRVLVVGAVLQDGELQTIRASP